MKRLLLFIAFATISAIASAQELKENKIDEFTKLALKRTSYETLVQNFKMNLFIRGSKIDSTTYLDIKLMIGGKVFSIQENADLMLMLENDSIVTLKNLKFALSCKGCGAKGFAGSAAEGVQTSYVIDDAELKALTTHNIKKIRIYESDGYLEDEIKEKRSELLKKTLLLL